MVAPCAVTDTGWVVTTAAGSIVSQCPGACTPTHATTVTLSARAKGTESSTAPAFQFLNPFPAGVSFYYEDPTTTEWILIGTVPSPSVSDNAAATVRAFTWTFGSWDPPAGLVAPLTVNIVAIGVNSVGDALVHGEQHQRLAR